MLQHLPFQKLTTRGWQNLGLMIVLILYGIRIGEGYYSNGVNSVPGDYICFWTAGKLANEAGYAKMYDLNALFEMQKNIIPGATVVLPMFYLPVFIFQFQILALMPIVLSYWLWTLLNLFFLIMYLCYFLKRIHTAIPNRILFMMMVAFPVFQNFYAGQINLFLFLAIGEFIHALMCNKQIHAGIWLALLLLKPQTLILILPVLLVQKNWKTMVTFGITSLLVLLISFILIGTKGLNGLSVSWLVESIRNSTVAPENMANWRMVAIRAGGLTTPIFGWVLAGAGIASTVFFAFALWRKPITVDSPNYILAWFGTISATNLIAWHSHAHMAVILIPLLCYLYARNLLPTKIINAWCFLPFLCLLAGSLIVLFYAILTPIILPTTMADFLLSLGLLIAMYYFLIWSYFKIKESIPVV